jgi:hypothetical protein
MQHSKQTKTKEGLDKVKFHEIHQDDSFKDRSDVIFIASRN